MKDDRNWNDPTYKAWRLAVYRRDVFTCQMPGCGRKGFSVKIQAHHIKRWAEFPELRFQLTNGITLCKRCHSNIESQEQSYEPIFMNIVSKKENKPLQTPKPNNGAFDAKRFLYCEDEGEELSC